MDQCKSFCNTGQSHSSCFFDALLNSSPSDLPFGDMADKFGVYFSEKTAMYTLERFRSALVYLSEQQVQSRNQQMFVLGDIFSSLR